MRKVSSVDATSKLPLLFTIFFTFLVGFFLSTGADAKASRETRTKQPASGKKAKAVAGKSAKSSRQRTAKKRSSRKNRIARNKRRSTYSRSKATVSDNEAKALLKKRSKLTRAERQKLSSYRSARRRRARARYLARLRVLRARADALRNITAANILKDNTTGEDPEIRRAVVDALEGRSGTAVVMDPTTGRIYTVVNQQMALGSPVKPCSTVKLIVGLAALHEEVFDPNQDIQISRRGSLHLTDAMARSDNPFFQVLGRRLGFERVVKYAGDYGFGDLTGINYPGEKPGFLPEEGEQETGLMSSHGENFGVTAIQLATFTSAIANGGYLYTPYIPRTQQEQANFEPILKRKIVMSPEDRLRLMAGMSGAVNFGTGRLAYNPLGQVAGKTGTCTGSRDKLGLFTSFSSADNPKVVVTVITTGYTEAGPRAAAIAGKIYAAISPRFFNEPEVKPASAATDSSTSWK
jgi:penicillin-binding protein 2